MLALILVACSGNQAPSEPVPSESAPGANGATPPPPALRKPIPPTPQEVEAYRQEFDKTFAKPVTRIEAGRVGPNTRIARIEGFTHGTVATLTGDGTVKKGCAEDPAGALGTVTEPQTPLEEK